MTEIYMILYLKHPRYGSTETLLYFTGMISTGKIIWNGILIIPSTKKCKAIETCFGGEIYIPLLYDTYSIHVNIVDLFC
jgi:hypothetical protein